MVRRIRRAIRGISPVLATLILIVVAVVAGLIVYVWVSGWMGRWLGVASRELKIVNCQFDREFWTKSYVGRAQTSGEKTYNLGHNWYEAYDMYVYVYDTEDNEHTLTRSGDNLMCNGQDVGDIQRYNPWKITINFTTLSDATGATFDSTCDVKVSAKWYRIHLRIANTGGVDISITEVRAGHSRDCPDSWNYYVKFTTLPWTIRAGDEEDFYISRSWDAGKNYYFKFKIDSEYLGPYGPFTAP